LGNKGKMTAGDVQWMTAGIGILHQEMPKGDSRGRIHGFQLWANLPANLEDDRSAVSGHSGKRDPRNQR
jgi:redox-sensitive bicupin YhaK (pirin superfamily)